MKTGKAIIVVTVTGVLGYLAYLYFKNQKTIPESSSSSDDDNGTGGGFLESLPPFIQNILPSNSNDSGVNNTNTQSSNTGTSVVTPDPLSTSETKVKEAVITEIKKEETAYIESQAKEAQDYIAKRALVERVNLIKAKLESIKGKPSGVAVAYQISKELGFSSTKERIDYLKSSEDILKNQYGLYPDSKGYYKM